MRMFTKQDLRLRESWIKMQYLNRIDENIDHQIFDSSHSFPNDTVLSLLDNHLRQKMELYNFDSKCKLGLIVESLLCSYKSNWMFWLAEETLICLYCVCRQMVNNEMDYINVEK